MATGAICFEKLHEKNKDIHYYKITSPHYKNSEMFVIIDGKKKELAFFLTSSFKNPVKEISFSSDKPIGSIEGINNQAFMAAISHCIRLIKSNNFPSKTSAAS